MIASFADEATESFYNGVPSKAARQWQAIAKVAHRKLDMIEAAHVLDDLKVPPGNHLEKLAGNLAGSCSIRINQQWRIVFKWTNGAAHDVRITDYH